jgi:hypothetical protein
MATLQLRGAAGGFERMTRFDDTASPWGQVAESTISSLTGRVTADPETAERGLVQLVLTLVELLRQVMERQTVGRLDAGAMTPEEIERVGRTLMLLENRMAELRDHFGLTPEDLNLDLGPLGKLL